MQSIHLTNAQARRFLLRLHGLIGEHTFYGAEGVLQYIRQCGCIQFDPIDVCGKNAELVLQSRVRGFTKQVLYDLLYEERQLVDYFDKNLAIFPVSDWPYFERERADHRARGRSIEEVDRVAEGVLSLLSERAFVSARELGMREKTSWYWSDSTLSRAVLETLYFRGDLCVHHKQGTNKYYALARNCIPEEILAQGDPNRTDAQYRAWLMLRRIGAVGMLWDKGSDAFLCVRDLKGGGRTQGFAELIATGKLIQIAVEGIAEPLYARHEQEALLAEILADTAYAPRMELIAPLDCLLWDRKLIRQLFDFAYTWEIYTPAAKRQFGYYVLPLLYGESFVGRVEAVAERKTGVLRVKGVWWEKRSHKSELKKCLKRFAAFNGCREVVWDA